MELKILLSSTPAAYPLGRGCGKRKRKENRWPINSALGYRKTLMSHEWTSSCSFEKMFGPTNAFFSSHDVPGVFYVSPLGGLDSPNILSVLIHRQLSVLHGAPPLSLLGAHQMVAEPSDALIRSPTRGSSL